MFTFLMTTRRFRGIAVSFLAVATAGASLAVILPAAPGDEKETLRLTLQPPTEPIRPGEFVTVPFVLTNVASRPLLLALNQGDNGGSVAAKTLTIALTHAASDKSLQTVPFCGCPVGEGFEERHFHRLDAGGELKGEIRVYWDGARQVPPNIARGDWRLRVQYVRAQNAKPGRFDEPQAGHLWKQSEVVKSSPAEIVLRVADWDDAATAALARRISQADPAAVQIAYVARLAAVFPQATEALFDLTRFPAGQHYDFRMAAVQYLTVAPFDEAGPALLKVLQEPKFDGIYQVKYGAVYGFAQFPRSVAGPWLIKTFHDTGEDRQLQDKLLGALAHCGYQTDDAQILAFMMSEVRSANPDQLSSATAPYHIDACVALGVKNTRPVLEEIARRLPEVRDEHRRDHLHQMLTNALAQE